MTTYQQNNCHWTCTFSKSIHSKERKFNILLGITIQHKTQFMLVNPHQTFNEVIAFINTGIPCIVKELPL